MPPFVKIHLLPKRAAPGELTGQPVVVIDVLRASTTIVQALAAGATCVVPVATVEEARAAVREFPDSLLCGERQGLKVDGFDLGNSPAEYTPQTVGGRRVVLTTTNGTRALSYCREARPVLIGAFTNLTALCERLAAFEQVHLVCAGTDGEVTREDVLLAGAVLDHCQAAPVGGGAELAQRVWQRADVSHLPAELADTAGGRNLIRLGMEADLAWAAHVDQHTIVPVLDSARGEIGWS